MQLGKQGRPEPCVEPGLDRDLLGVLELPAPQAAPLLLGSLLSHTGPEGTVTLRLTEIEAYGGPADSDLPDPGAHTFNGRTARNASMFGPAGRVYVYFTYGMHHAVNLVCRPAGTAGGCLIRAGEVLEGTELARQRRSVRRRTPVPDLALARGPGNVAQALSLTLADDGALLTSDLAATGLTLRRGGPVAEIVTTARTGVSGPGGGPEYPWRFAVAGDPTVSPYRAAVTRNRRRG
ncbi:DNA-3-methyladenine glycosylase [Kocuria soli]|uniref:Putative 3-methyladenine DNA glycosylase n=1 Tax=Kocuria soli TaxID=2485125 RepID=A0A3N3ZVS7_9MICC|nr:DNA-3-methyladenine glycosylase [Kocuria soli]ROZ62523.1 DNA-3-methyladenine glycosylase [Kocuria soli]